MSVTILDSFASFSLDCKEKQDVLFVDDNKMQRAIATRHLNKLLEHKKYIIAEDGEAAIEALNRYQFKVVICDYEMPPGMNGIETLCEWQKIVKNSKNKLEPPIIILNTSAPKEAQSEKKYNEAKITIVATTKLGSISEFREILKDYLSESLTPDAKRRSIIEEQTS